MSIESVLILGIGNRLLTDEGVGVHVIERMRADIKCDHSVEYLDGGTLSFTLAEPIARADGLIVVDAARMDSPPGTVNAYHGDDMDNYLTGNRHSVHEVSLSDLLDITRLTESLPSRRCLVGIEPLTTDWGELLSQEVRPSVDEAINKILSILSGWKIECRKKTL